MPKGTGSRFEKYKKRLTERDWRALAENAWTQPLDSLRKTRGDARGLRQHIDRVLHVADQRLSLPRIGNQTFRKPPGTDWAWRPDLWCGAMPEVGYSSVQNGARFGPQLALFHDCPEAEITLRQLRNRKETDLAAYGLALDIFQFRGNYLSLAIDLPPDAIRNLTKRHILQLDTIVELEKPLEIFARLNIRHGPNTEQVAKELPLTAQDIRAEFDLAYTKINEKRIEAAWVDLIFEGPELNQVILRDVTFSRRLRANL